MFFRISHGYNFRKDIEIYKLLFGFTSKENYSGSSSLQKQQCIRAYQRLVALTTDLNHIIDLTHVVGGCHTSTLLKCPLKTLKSIQISFLTMLNFVKRA